jgi:hypothetical protein
VALWPPRPELPPLSEGVGAATDIVGQYQQRNDKQRHRVRDGHIPAALVDMPILQVTIY